MKQKLILCLCMILASTAMFAQNLTVQGTVTEQATGYPALGTSIQVKGTTNGTVADMDGNYLISNVPSNAVLVFSAIGMATQEIPVGGRSSINVALVEDHLMLDETVVIGYGTAKSKDLTGSIASVKADEIVSTPISSPMGALQGKIAGVQVVNSGAPGSTPIVRVRGVGSFDSGY